MADSYANDNCRINFHSKEGWKRGGIATYSSYVVACMAAELISTAKVDAVGWGGVLDLRAPEHLACTS